MNGDHATLKHASGTLLVVSADLKQAGDALLAVSIGLEGVSAALTALASDLEGMRLCTPLQASRMAELLSANCADLARQLGSVYEVIDELQEDQTSVSPGDDVPRARQEGEV